MNLIKGDCLEELKKIPDKSVDFVYTDLPYNQTACKWDQNVIDLDALWVQLKRIAKNDRTPFFFSCTTKFGYNLIKANEKWFRWDLVWKKNRAAGFLNAYKLPMRKHEMVYCFSKKCPEYDVSSHKTGEEVVKPSCKEHISMMEMTGGRKCMMIPHKSQVLNEPLPTSDITPPTPEHELVYCFAKKCPEYDVSSHTDNYTTQENKSNRTNAYAKEGSKHKKEITAKLFKDPLPTSDITLPPIDIDIDEEQPPSSWCEVNNDEKTGHRTAKPVALMEFLLKYWTKPGWTVLDPTMGSGSMGIACKKMGRNFIGMELDDDIYKLAQKRISDTVVSQTDISLTESSS